MLSTDDATFGKALICGQVPGLFFRNFDEIYAAPEITWSGWDLRGYQDEYPTDNDQDDDLTAGAQEDHDMSALLDEKRHDIPEHHSPRQLRNRQFQAECEKHNRHIQQLIRDMLLAIKGLDSTCREIKILQAHVDRFQDEDQQRLVKKGRGIPYSLIIPKQKRLKLLTKAVENIAGLYPQDHRLQTFNQTIQNLYGQINSTVNLVWEMNLGLVDCAIRKYYSHFFEPSGHNVIEKDDVLQEGRLGLRDAILTYDAEVGALSTYATWKIRGRLDHFLKDHCRVVRLPDHWHDQNIQINKAEQELARELSRLPEIKELSERLNLKSPHKRRNYWSEDRIEGLKFYFQPVASMDAPVSYWQEPGSSMTLKDLIPAPDDFPLEDTVIRGELTDSLEQVLLTLSPQERQIVRMKFGVGYDREMVYDEIRQEDGLQVSKVRIGQLADRALRKIELARSYQYAGIVGARSPSLKHRFASIIGLGILSVTEEKDIIGLYGIGNVQRCTPSEIKKIFGRKIPSIRARVKTAFEKLQTFESRVKLVSLLQEFCA